MGKQDSYLKKQQKNFSFGLLFLPAVFIFLHDWSNFLLAVIPLGLSHLLFKFQKDKRKRSPEYLKKLLIIFILCTVIGSINGYYPDSNVFMSLLFALALAVIFVIDYKAADESKDCSTPIPNDKKE